MAFKLRDRVRETSVSTGTGDLSLAGAVDSSYRTFGFVLSDGDTTWATIRMGADWETSLVTYNATPGTLSRTTVLESTNGGARVNFTAGTKDIMLGWPSARAADLFDNTGAANQIRWDSAQSLTAAQKATAIKNTSQACIAKSSGYTAVSNDRKALFVLTGTATLALTAAGTLGDGWSIDLHNNGTGLWTVDPNSTETIDGLATIPLYPGEGCRIVCDGTGFYTVGWYGSPVGVSAKSSSYTAALIDKGTLLVLTGSATLSITAAATLGSRWSCSVRNNGTGVWVIDPNSSEAIDGQTTIRVYPGECFDIRCDGSAFYTIGRQKGKILLSSAVAASSASISFGSAFLGSDFNHWTLELCDIVPATNNVQLGLTISQDDGSSYKSANYYWGRTGVATGIGASAVASTGSADSKISLVDTGLDNGAADNFSGNVEMFGLSKTGNYKQFNALLSYYSTVSSLGQFTSALSGVYLGDGFPINNIKIAMSSGNIASGNFNLFGHRV